MIEHNNGGDLLKISGHQVLMVFIIFVFYFSFLMMGWYSLNSQLSSINITIQQNSSGYNRDLTLIQSALTEIQNKHDRQWDRENTIMTNILEKIQDIELKITSEHPTIEIAVKTKVKPIKPKKLFKD
jgi:predicted PurR-regulated permease PerM